MYYFEHKLQRPFDWFHKDARLSYTHVSEAWMKLHAWMWFTTRTIIIGMMSTKENIGDDAAFYL